MVELLKLANSKGLKFDEGISAIYIKDIKFDRALANVTTLHLTRAQQKRTIKGILETL